MIIMTGLLCKITLRGCEENDWPLQLCVLREYSIDWWHPINYHKNYQMLSQNNLIEIKQYVMVNYNALLTM